MTDRPYYTDDDAADDWLRQHDPEYPTGPGGGYKGKVYAPTRNPDYGMGEVPGYDWIMDQATEPPQTLSIDAIAGVSEDELFDAMESLPDRDQMILSMRFWERCTYQAIATALGFPNWDRKAGMRAVEASLEALKGTLDGSSQEQSAVAA